MQKNAYLICKVDDGGSKRVLTVALCKAHNSREQLCWTQCLRDKQDDLCDLRTAEGEGASLIKHYSRHFVCHFKMFAPLDENSIPCPHARPDHDGSGRGQSKGTWTRDEENGHGMDEGLTDVVAVGRRVRTCTTLRESQ